jgi:hypothetical protein
VQTCSTGIFHRINKPVGIRNQHESAAGRRSNIFESNGLGTLGISGEKGRIDGEVEAFNQDPLSL